MQYVIVGEHAEQGRVHWVQVPDMSKYPVSQGHWFKVRVLWLPLQPVQYVELVVHEEQGKVHAVQTLVVEA